MTLYDANTKELFDRAVKNLKELGYVWATDFPNHEPTFQEMKANLHGNSKLLIHAFWNSTLNRAEFNCTSKSILKTYPQYKGIVDKIDLIVAV